MPELPEVETIKRQLESQILGSEIVGIVVNDSRCFVAGRKGVEGEVIKEILRVGKYLFVRFSSGRGLQIHLKMTGRVVVEQETQNMEYAEAKHTRVVITLRDKRRIFYWDTRMFGYIKVLENVETEHEALKKKLGPEPWDITDIDLLRKFKRTGRAVKEVILDQNVLAGVGNIYANDGLWLAGMNPRRIAKSLKPKEVARLRKSLCKVLERGLATGGASDNSYVNAYGEKGSYQDEFLTYRRAGEPCKKCGKLVERIVVGGRGTWVCGKCQK